jgi:hypothetical protein
MQVYFIEQDSQTFGKKETGEFVSQYLLKANSLVSMWLFDYVQTFRVLYWEMQFLLI